MLAYAHDGGEAVLRGGRDLQTGCPDVLDDGLNVTQLRRDGSLVHCEGYENIQYSIIKKKRKRKEKHHRTLGCQRHRCQVSGKVEQLWKVLVQRFGQNVQKSGFPIHRFCGAQLGEKKRPDNIKNQTQT